MLVTEADYLLAAGEKKMKSSESKGAAATREVGNKRSLDIREHVEQDDYRTIGSPFVDDAKMTARNVNVFYDEKQAITNVSLDIGRNEVIAMIGPSGCGKSTFLRTLNRMNDIIPSCRVQGEFALDGEDIYGEEQDTVLLRARVGMVFQNPDDQLFSPTVFDDVAFGPLHMGLPEAEVRQRVGRALDMVGMAGFEARLSHHLSLGQKKRIAIATVLSMEPEILVLDEPSAGLDPRARRALITLLRDLPLTMLVSTHDMFMVHELFPRMVVMDEGRVVADGETAVLLADDALLEQHGLESPRRMLNI